MKTKTTTTYITSDGREWTNEKEAYEHEEAIKGIKYFRIAHSPDLTEGRGYMRVSWIAVNALCKHEQFAEVYCEQAFGNKWVFVQGVCGSNCITPKWAISEPYDEIVDKGAKLSATVEDRFAKKKIFGEGIMDVMGDSK